MKARITTRHFDVEEDVRRDIESKVLSCVEKYFKDVVELDVTLTMEKSRFIAEADITVKKVSFHARDEMHSLKEAVDRVIDKLETQMRRYRDRKKTASREHREFSLQ